MLEGQSDAPRYNLSNIAINIRTKEPECVIFDLDMASGREQGPAPHPLGY